MTPQTIRLVLGFLAVFILISIAPGLPDLAQGLGQAVPTEQFGDLLLCFGAGFVVSGGAIAFRRGWQRQRVASPRVRQVRQLKPLRQLGSGSGLGLRIRQASRQGARVPELARRFNLSQDAIRVAIGRDGTIAAAPKGTSFRPRQVALPAKPRALPAPARRRPYQALA